ncbi:MAG: hypothetical protein K2H78_00620, partial [Clostridia bacterium]|nr:hypothetical protein [Clostridia bacterium]
TNTEEANRRMEEERAKRLEAEKKQQELEAKANESAQQLEIATKGMAEAKAELAKVERVNRANRREKSTVSSGRRAA